MKAFAVFFFSILLISSSFGINVRDFGAKGDGKTDDTLAIQKAVSHLASKIKLDRFRNEDGWYKGTTETHVDELYFPAGTYLISHTIFAKGSVAWKGESGKSKIIMTDADKDILYCHIYRRALFDGMTFSGGRVQLQLWNNNWNASSVNIRNCKFLDSSAPAVRSISRRTNSPKEMEYKTWKRDIKTIPTYDVVMKKGVPQYKLNDIDNSICWYSSNIIFIKSSAFLNCMQAFETDADGTLLDDCDITANPKSKGPVMIAGIGPAPNMLTLWRVRANAKNSAEKQYWIKNDGFHLSCNDCSFTSVKPMKILRQETLKTKCHPIPGSVTFNRCQFKFAEAPEALIDIYRVPCVLKLVDNCSNLSTEMAKWHVTPDEKYIKKDSFQGKHQGVSWSEKLKYNFITAENTNINSNIPKSMQKYCYPARKIRARAMNIAEEIKLPESEIFAADFGVVGDGKTDNTSALTKALAEAAKLRKTLVIPSGRIRIGSTIKLPSFVSLRGQGMPVIHGDKRNAYNLFEADNCEITAFRTLILRNAKQVLDAKLGSRSRLVQFDDCLIYDTDALSVKLSGKENNALFRTTGSLWIGAGGIDTSCRSNEVVLCWFSNNFWMDDMAFFTLRKGCTVLMRSPFFVPYVSKNVKRTNIITKESKVWELGGNLRWVDNDGGNVYMHTPRGGGEAGGYCLLRQISDGGEIYVTGGLSRFTNKDTSNCIFYADAAPNEVVLTAIAGYPIHTLLGVRQRVFMKSDKVKDLPLYTLGVMYCNEKYSEPKKSSR